jgi:hypothetical protein
MASVIEYRVMLNRPGPGWYWEVLHKHEIVARGLADTHRDAAVQATAASKRWQAAPTAEPVPC